jgi:hypothetical protein
VSDERNHIPPPGSDEAVREGCRCPILDNARGAGWMGTGEYWVNRDCPLHGKKRTEPTT